MTQKPDPMLLVWAVCGLVLGIAILTVAWRLSP